jgi:hypothetical protein
MQVPGEAVRNSSILFFLHFYIKCRILEPTHMDQITKYLMNHGGYARMKDMKASGIHTREIQRFVRNGGIVKVKPGLCRLSDIQPGKTSGL